MSDTLPINIYPSIELVEQYQKINSICNKLAAFFNFQTLTANWYGNEEEVLSINIYLVNASGFAFQQKQKHSGIKTEHANDVISFYDGNNLTILTFIALTQEEETLLLNNPKLLKNLLTIKIKKVLNLLAATQSLAAI